MHSRVVWPQNPIFIEVGVQHADLALNLRHEGYSKYLGVSSDARRIERLQAEHPELAGQFTFSKRRKLVLHNNADVLILSGTKMFYWWKFHAVRHVQCVSWRLSFNPLCLVAFLGCLFHMFSRRCSRPRIVTFRLPGGKTRRLLVSRILKYRLCHRRSLHFIPHQPGLPGLFRQFDKEGVRYVVLRWFDALPEIEPSEDVDMLIEDASLPKALQIMQALPGIQPSDVYSETGLTRSDYCGVAYYPPAVARRILDGAIRHKDLCFVPNPSDYFHSLAYHAVYHKGVRSGLPRGETGLQPKGEPGHDYTGILQSMATDLGIDVEISLEGLHAYLQENGWGPAPDLLARLAAACPRNRWLQLLAKRLTPEIQDQGLSVFVLRQEAVRRGYQDTMLKMIEQSGFKILAVKALSPAEVQYAAARSRGGNWSIGPYSFSGGPPAVAVVAYDPNPIPPNRKQRRKYPLRTNARIFIKDEIRDFVQAESPRAEQFNALHSSDHAAEAWHLIETMAPEMMEEIRSRLNLIRKSVDVLPLAAGSLHERAAVAVPLRRAS